MSNTLKTIAANIHTARQIVDQMQLSQDETIKLQMAEAAILYDGLSVNHEGLEPVNRDALNKLHSHSISLILDDVVRNCLAYYALPEQPEGTNEPPIGPVFASQLLAELDDLDLDLAAVKDQIHKQLEKAQQ